MPSVRERLDRLRKQVDLLSKGSSVYEVDAKVLLRFKSSTRDILKVLPKNKTFDTVCFLPKVIEDVDEWEKLTRDYCLHLWKKTLHNFSWSGMKLDDSELKSISYKYKDIFDKNKKDEINSIDYFKDIIALEEELEPLEDVNIGWAPLQGSQVLFLSCPCKELLYEGGRGFGKTETMLADFCRDVNKGFGAKYQGLLLRKSYGELADVINKSLIMFPKMVPGAVYVGNPHFYWRFPGGEKLKFSYMESVSDYTKYHGHEYQWLGIEEVSLWEDLGWIDKMKSCLRSNIKEIRERIRIRLTTNPVGVGKNAVKRRYIDNSRYGKVQHKVFKADFGGQVEEIDYTISSIFGNLLENRAMGAEYIANLMNTEDPELKKAYILGPWDVVAGGLLDDLWDNSVHVIEPFEIPDKWKIDRSYDHGEGHPFSIGWWAESDGRTPANGKIYPKGTIFRIDEFWGAIQNDDKKGLRYTVSEISEVIKAKEGTLGFDSKLESTSRVLEGRKVYPGPADSAMWRKENSDDLARDFKRNDIEWLPAKKKPGSRIQAKELLRSKLKASLEDNDSKPGIYFFNNCTEAIRLLPRTQRDPKNIEDAAKLAGDDLYDEICYRCLGAKSSEVFTGKKF